MPIDTRELRSYVFAQSDVTIPPEAKGIVSALCEAYDSLSAELRIQDKLTSHLRARMLEVLRVDPMRSVADDCSIWELVDLVCGDLIQARARIERITARK